MIMKQQGFDFKSGGSRQELNGPVTDNPCRPRGFGLLNPDTMIPYQKNPVLSAFFREIDRADELGSGMRKMMLYGKKYGGVDPQLIEGDSFRMIISVPEFGENPAKTAKIIATKQITPEVAGEVTGEVTGEVARLLHAVSGEMKRTEMQAQLGLKHEDHFREAYLLPALAAGLMEMTLPDKPNSRLQKYRLTAKGQQWLKENRS